MNILKETTISNCIINDTEEELTRLLEINKNKLLPLLKSEEKSLFEKYNDCFEDLFEMVKTNEYGKSFKAGAKLIMEILYK